MKLTITLMELSSDTQPKYLVIALEGDPLSELGLGINEVISDSDLDTLIELFPKASIKILQ